MMIEELYKNFFRLEIPLPKNPLRALNSYVIRGDDRNLIIDTGWNQEECLLAMKEGLKAIGIDLRKTDFFITHLHADHIGLISRIANEQNRIYFNKPDADRLKSNTLWEDAINFARLHGFPESELISALNSHPGFKFGLKWDLLFNFINDGDEIDLGDFKFKAIHTPGHSKGHMCLYEQQKKIFISGDHVLYDITPTIQLWSDDWNPLKEYMESLNKVYNLDVEIVLPGHRNTFRDLKGRIHELRKHHKMRLDEILNILKFEAQDAYQIASQMTWDIVYDSWDLFPVSQKWFGFGETIAHLKYLVEEGIVSRDKKNQKVLFMLT